MGAGNRSRMRIEMAGSDCADTLAAAFRGRGRLSEKDIRTITESIQRHAGRQGTLNLSDQEFQRIAREVAASIRESAVKDRTNARLKVAVKQRGDDLAKHYDAFDGDPGEAIKAMDVGSNKPGPGNRISVGGLQESLPPKYGGMFVNLLERDNW